MNMNFKYLLLATICFIYSYGYISAQVFKNSELSISKLEDGIWMVETSDNTTMYIIEGTKKAMLIDTGTKCAQLDSIVKLITQKPLYVVITHAHGDHDGNIRYFNDIYLHPADTVLFDKSYNGKVHYLKDGEIFHLGGKNIEVRHMPAHTPGSVVLLDKKSGSCFTGDAFGSGQVWLQLKPFAPIKTYINSCKKMERLMDKGITKIYCGHYPYPKKAFDKSYIDSMLKLAEGLYNGTVTDAQPYSVKVSIGCENPMIVTDGEANIVYDPGHLK
jgi:hydroxyacylglutathione hydrolase